MQKKKHAIGKAVLISTLILVLLILSFLLYVYFGLSKEIDLSLIRTGGSSITRVYAFERENGIVDVYNPKELEEERIFYNCEKDGKNLYDEYVEEGYLVAKINHDFDTAYYYKDQINGQCDTIVEKTFYRTKEEFN